MYMEQVRGIKDLEITHDVVAECRNIISWMENVFREENHHNGVQIEILGSSAEAGRVNIINENVSSACGVVDGNSQNNIETKINNNIDSQFAGRNRCEANINDICEGLTDNSVLHSDEVTNTAENSSGCSDYVSARTDSETQSNDELRYRLRYRHLGQDTSTQRIEQRSLIESQDELGKNPCQLSSNTDSFSFYLDNSYVVVPIINRNQVSVVINSHSFVATLDSGAEASAVSMDFVTKLGGSYNKDTGNKCPYTANGLQVKILGRLKVMVEIEDFAQLFEFVILEGLVDMILMGVDFLDMIGAQMNFENHTLSIRKNSVEVVMEQGEEQQIKDGGVNADKKIEEQPEIINWTDEDEEMMKEALGWV